MNLTDTAAATKKGVRLFAIFGSIFLVLWIIFLVLYNTIWLPYQKSQVRPEQRFGALQKPKFPATLASTSSFNYVLDTASGTLPSDIPRLMNVFFIPPQETSLLAPERARQLAISLGFNGEPQILSPSVYQYTDPYGGTLSVELSTGNFNTKRVVPATVTIGTQEAPPLQSPSLADEKQVINELTGYLKGKRLLSANFEEPRGIVIYDNPNFQLAERGRASLWPKNVGDIPIVSTNPEVGPITAIVSKYTDLLFKYLEIDYRVWSYDDKTFSSYEVLSAEAAFEKLKNGEGVIVKNNTKGGNASLTKIYIAYYLPTEYMPYLEPIYVFEGKDFVAYVSALTDGSYSN